MIFEQPDLSDLRVSFWSVLVPVVLGLGGFGGLVVILVGRSMLLRQVSGVDEMIGLIGQATTPIDLDGKVFVRGEFWNAVADQAIGKDEPVEVLGVEGLRLRVRAAMSTR